MEENKETLNQENVVNTLVQQQTQGETSTFENHVTQENAQVEASTINNNLNGEGSVKKKSKKGLIVLLVILLLLVLGIVLCHFVIFSPERIVKNNISITFDTMKSAVKEYYKNNMTYDLDKESLGVSGNIKFESDFNKNGLNLNKLKSYNANYDFVIDKASNKASYGINVTRGNKDFLNIKSFINGKTSIIDYGDLFNRTYKSVMDSEIRDITLGSSVGQEDIITLLDRTKKFALDHVSKDKIEKNIGSFEVDGKKSLFTKVKYELNEDKYASDLVEFYKNDKESMKALVNMTGKNEKEIKEKIEFELSGASEPQDQETLTINAYYNVLPIMYKYIELSENEETILVERAKDVINFKSLSKNKEILKGSYDFKESRVLLDVNEDGTSLNADFTIKEKDINGSMKMVSDGQTFTIGVDSKTDFRKNSESKNSTTVNLSVSSEDVNFSIKAIANTEIKTGVKAVELKEKNSYTDETISESESEILINNYTKKLMIFINDIYPELAKNFESMTV